MTADEFTFTAAEAQEWDHLVGEHASASKIGDAYLRTARRLRDAARRVAALEQQVAEVVQPPSHYEFTHSKTWYAIRDACLAAADHHCQVCNSSDALQVHHRTYERFGGDELPGDLIALCGGCHEIFHRLRRLAGGGWNEARWQAAGHDGSGYAMEEWLT